MPVPPSAGVAGNVVALVVSITALWIGARLLVTGASRLAGAAGISSLVIGLTVVAFGTSAPEVVVSTGAALEGRGDVAVGNAVGSNLFNIGVILGLVAVITPFRVAESLVRRDAVAMAAATAVAGLVLFDGLLMRAEGVALVVLLGCYLGALWLAIRRDGESTDAPTAEPGTETGPPNDVQYGLEIGRVVAGLVLVVGGGRVLVDAAVTLAVAGGVSEWLIGATIVAAGTSMPELAASAVAARQGDVGIAAGNVVGSNVFNAFGVLGIAAVARPMVVDAAVFFGLAWLGVLTAYATVVLATGRWLSRLEGVGLLALGLGYWVASALL
ncbi:calcium/sodium antiporter [Halopiger goleimassiliensis]|uniref:calcium/sodium antiporter n=1 Tax=Halopiger goleimassiliensis TaxID=1293048 RepID=UPI00067768AC|nr:calcium/sodium antiporter [Halopiger goleimassiliensis]